MEIAKLWDAAAGWLNTATYGLPPRHAWDALQAALDEWRAGRGDWVAWTSSVEPARAAYARLIGVDPADVCAGAQVSQMLGPVAGALPDRATVLVPDNEFTSSVFPWAVHADRGVTMRTAPLDKLADHLDSGVDLVAFALVQSATGEIADYAGIVAAARAAGAWVVVDATQACGWLPFDGGLADVVVTGAYKWLMAPRGTGFCYLSPAVRERMRPAVAGWFAGKDVHSSYYGLPMVLADDARAFDLSPAWHSWVGTAAALEVVEQVGVETIQRHNVDLANRFLTGLGRPAGDSAIVTVSVPGAEERLAAAGIRAAVRRGQVRASFHIYTTESDVDTALDALA